MLLDLPAEVGAARRDEPDDRIEREGKAFFARVADGFRALARGDPDRWVVVDASGPQEEVARRVRAAVAERLGANGGNFP